MVNTHYTCFNASGTCQNKIYYVFRIYGNNPTTASCIKLENGATIEQALEEMLHSDDVNKFDSTIKKFIDTWYQNNLTKYTNYLEDTVWCNSRRFSDLSGLNPNGGGLVYNYLYFLQRARGINLVCPDIIDRFTVSKEKGNGALTYPVGLATEAEWSLSRHMFPFNVYNTFWYLSPARVENFPSVSFGQASNPPSFQNGGVAPSVSLRAGVGYVDGNGTSNKPYVIFTN